MYHFYFDFDMFSLYEGGGLGARDCMIYFTEPLLVVFSFQRNLGCLVMSHTGLSRTGDKFVVVSFQE